MEIHLGRVGRRDLSAEIYRQLRDAILDGTLRPGDRLSPTRELAQSLKVSRTTVTAAYERLLGEGFVTARVGAGTFVSEHVSTACRRDRRRVRGPLRPRPVWSSISLPTAFARTARFEFRTGLPDASLFRFQVWRRLMAREFRSSAVGPGIYGDPAGESRLREAVARHIGISRRVHASADDVTITSGTQQALDVVARVLLGAGDRVAVEDPGYIPARRLFESIGARIQGVGVDREGIVVADLHPRTRVVYVTPSHQYPLGIAMSLQRRFALLDWAERHNAAIVEDDYDSEFRLYDRPIEPLQALDRTARVIYMASFSKTLLPTLRLGFVVTPPALTRAVQTAKYVTDWHTSVPVQRTLASFIDEGELARHIRKAGAVYRERHEFLVDRLARDFDEHLDVITSAAGLHVGVRARTLSVPAVHAAVERAFDAGVAVQELAWFAFEREPLPGLALGFGAIATSRIGEGLRRLRRCFAA